VVLELGDAPGGRELLASFELEVGDVVAAIGQVDLRGAGGVERMLETANALVGGAMGAAHLRDAGLLLAAMSEVDKMGSTPLLPSDIAAR
jgi:hypothetical protein